MDRTREQEKAYRESPARRAYMREYQRNWRARRREEFFAGKSCIRCGSIDNLHLDHRDPSKKVSHRIWSWSEVRRLAELAKCQILCEACHRDKTVSNMEHAYGESLSKLKEGDVVEILANPAASTAELGKQFNVDPGTIRAIRRGDTWKHVPRSAP